MAGGVTAPAACFALLLLPLLLLLLPTGRAAADARCLRLLNSTNEHGQLRSDVRVDRACACERLALFVLKNNTSGMPVDCSQNGSWHDTKQVVPAAGGLAALRTVVAGCFQARCVCADGRHCRQHWHFDGLDYDVYNLVISAEQMPGLPPRLDVHARPYKNATHFYFQQLEVRLYRCRDKAVDPECRHDRVAGRRVAAATAKVRFELAGAREPLTPGRYRMEVLPHGSWVCQGSNNGCKRIELPVSLSGEPAVSSAELPPVGDDRMKVLYAVIGVTLAVIAAGLVFVWRECSAVRPDRGASFPAKTPPSSGAQVLLVHLWAGERLAQLKAELRRAGLQVLDVQERTMSSQLRTRPVADVLVSDRLRYAKIVFLCSERALQLERGPAAAGGGGFSSAAGCLLGPEALFSAVLHCVRNSALAQDYRRVFVVLPEAGGGGDASGPAALVPGCRFRWPADGPELIRQLNLEPSETDRERVV